jgi:hypothetical protein
LFQSTPARVHFFTSRDFCYHQSEDQKFSQNSEKQTKKSWLVQHFLHRKQTALQISVFNAWIILFGALTSPAHQKKKNSMARDNIDRLGCTTLNVYKVLLLIN